MNYIEDKTLVARLKACTNLPTPPGVAAQIIELGQDVNADVGDIADVVSRDPALTAKLLKLANSPFYSRQRKTENLRQAIILFGLNGTLTLALGFSLIRDLKDRGDRSLDYQYFWRRCLTSAIAASNICVALGLGLKEQYFIAGLLQDIGVLAIDKALPEVYEDSGECQFRHRWLSRLEVSKLGCDHACVGAWLLETWHLPEYVLQSVHYSHDPASCQDGEYQKICAAVAISGELAEAVWTPEDPYLDGAATMSETLLDLDRNELADLVDKIGSELKETAGIFDIDLGDPLVMEGMMDQAAETLAMRSLESIKQTAELNEVAEELEARTRELENQAQRDSLTGLYNRGYFDFTLGKEFDAAKRHGWPIALLFVDLDHFKSINDTHGHQAGDEVIRGAATLLRHNVRGTDVLARYGGEEFVIILPGTGANVASTVYERILKSFRETTVRTDTGSEIDVRASIGIAVQGDGGHEFESAFELINAADSALYQAKSNGRDQCCAYETGMVESTVANAS